MFFLKYEQTFKGFTNMLTDTRKEKDKTKSDDRQSGEDVHRSRSRDTKEKTRNFPPPPRLQDDKGEQLNILVISV